MGALVGADAPRSVLLHAHACEESGAGEATTVRAGVVLAQRPDGRFVLADQNPLVAPAGHRGGRVLVRVASVRAGEVDLHDVERAAGHERGAQLFVDHVVGRRDHVLERAGGGRLVAKGAERLDVCHRGRHPSGLDSPGRGVAKPGIALALGARDRRFESGRPD